MLTSYVEIPPSHISRSEKKREASGVEQARPELSTRPLPVLLQKSNFY
ncbi:hypothetical protein [Herbaspirillum huttiense]